MKISFAIWILCIFNGTGQNILRGKVIDGNTKLPLELADVFVSNTTYQTITNDKGAFNISVPVNKFQLAASFVGYESVVINSTSFADLSKEFVIELFPEVNSIKVVNVLSSEKRKFYLDIFKRNLLGNTAISQKAKILNLHDVNLNIADNGTLEVSADVPLEIDNPELNYHLTFLLSYFKVDFESRTSVYAGYPSYRDLVPITDRNRKKIMKRRKQAYFGSTMHFIRACYSGTYENEGFTINSFTQTLNPAYPVTSILPAVRKQSAQAVGVFHHLPPQYLIAFTHQNLKPDQLVTTENDQKYFNIPDWIEVIYTKANVEIEYSKQINCDQGFQTSQIKPEISPIELFSDGNYSNPQALVFYGYMGWKKLADSLPFDYVPEE